MLIEFHAAEIAGCKRERAHNRGEYQHQGEARFADRDGFLGSACVPRAGERVSRSRTFPQRAALPEIKAWGKILSARRRNQHAGRVRYPKHAAIGAKFFHCLCMSRGGLAVSAGRACIKLSGVFPAPTSGKPRSRMSCIARSMGMRTVPAFRWTQP